MNGMDSKISHEKRIVEAMVRLYCYRKEKNQTICPDCEALVHYAFARLDKCKFGVEKPDCQHCVVHCYKPEMRERIRLVMRFSGPRMFFYAPLATIRHFINSYI